MVLVAFALCLSAPKTELTYVRHGETVANATGVYNAKNLNTLSDLGEKGVAALTQRLLAQPKYDRILVSPAPRTMRTIAPYLRATGQKATIWPLAYECCTGRRPKGVKASSFKWGSKIGIPDDLVGLFVLEKGHDRYPVSPDYASGLAQAAAALKEFRERSMSGRVLVVGHSGFGGQFLHGLTGKRLRVENTKEMKFTLP